MAYGELDFSKWLPIIPMDKPNVVYILRLCTGNFYIGSTTNFLKRMKDHEDGIGLGAKLTQKNPPQEVSYIECFKTYLEARQREEQIKRVDASQNASQKRSIGIGK